MGWYGDSYKARQVFCLTDQSIYEFFKNQTFLGLIRMRNPASHPDAQIHLKVSTARTRLLFTELISLVWLSILLRRASRSISRTAISAIFDSMLAELASHLRGTTSRAQLHNCGQVQTGQRGGGCDLAWNKLKRERAGGEGLPWSLPLRAAANAWNRGERLAGKCREGQDQGFRGTSASFKPLVL